jgi:hypothetical protein
MVHYTDCQKKVIFTLFEHAGPFYIDNITHQAGVTNKTVKAMVKRGILFSCSTDDTEDWFYLPPFVVRWAFRNLSKSPFLK